DRLHRDALVGRGVEPRLSRRALRARRAAGLRPRAARARAADQVGGHGDLDVLERLHGRRGALGRACGERGPRGPVKRALALAALLAIAAAAPASARDKWDTRVLAHIGPPGFPALSLVAPDGRVYVGTYENPSGDTL